MALNYNNLWHRLIDCGMTKTQLRIAAGMSTGTFAKLSKGEALNTSTLEKMCKVLGCDIGDIVSYVPDDDTKEDRMNEGKKE